MGASTGFRSSLVITMAGAQLGIQQLLNAEQDAQLIVNQAREAKGQMIKKARDEALQEVEQYRKAKQDEFARLVQEQTSTTDDNSAQLAQTTDAEIQVILGQANAKGEDVISLLLKAVQDVCVDVDDGSRI